MKKDSNLLKWVLLAVTACMILAVTVICVVHFSRTKEDGGAESSISSTSIHQVSTKKIANDSDEQSVFIESLSDNEIGKYIVSASIEVYNPDDYDNNKQASEAEPTFLLDFTAIDALSIPEYSGKAYIELHDNYPDFKEEDIYNPVFERYSDLDSLGRCGVATAKLGKELFPTEDRGFIGNIKPTGWHTVKYPELISDLYLYNRCHLIAYALAGENANEKNLITGTRYMNVSGMLPFETEVVKYIEKTGNHVLYRVTPCFVEQELLARGVHIEAFSVEDEGKGVCFNVFVYNVQPGVVIDYTTGDSYTSN